MFRAITPILIAIFFGACGSPTGMDITVDPGTAFTVLYGSLSTSDNNYKMIEGLGRNGWEFEVDNKDLQLFTVLVYSNGWWTPAPYYVKENKIILPEGYVVCGGAGYKITIIYGTAK